MTRHLTARALLLLAIVGATPMLRAQCTPANPAGCVISPATLEINLGALPVDRYWGCPNTVDPNTGQRIVPSCNDDNITVRDCIKGILANYRSQGATGVRFLFGMGGGAYSTPFNPSGQGLRPWMAKLNDFLQDVHDAGYTKVTPTPVLDAPWSAASSNFYTTRTDLIGCGAVLGLRFVPWLPFGFKRPEPGFPDYQGPDDVRYMVPQCQGVNNGYKLPAQGGAEPNPYFWGWDKFFKLMEFVFQKVVANNLTIADFDLQNELDLFNYTVEGRLIFDNTNEVDVLDGFPEPHQYPWQGGIRGLMETYFGTDAGKRVTFSSTIFRPAIPDPLPLEGIDCGSYYGDSAMIIGESERLAAFGNAWVGRPGNLLWINGLPCRIEEQPGEDGMIKLGVLKSQPTVTNIHAYPCFESSCNSTEPADATSVAQNLYSDVWTYLQVRSMTTNTVMFGEVSPTHNSTDSIPPCMEVYNNRLAYNNVNGFMQSTLPGSQAGPNTVLRVWYNIQNPCYAQGTPPIPPIKPPYGH